MKAFHCVGVHLAQCRGTPGPMSGYAWPENFRIDLGARTRQGCIDFALAIDDPNKINNTKHVPDRRPAAGDVVACLPTVMPNTNSPWEATAMHAYHLDADFTDPAAEEALLASI